MDILSKIKPKKELSFDETTINIRARKHFQEILKKCNFSSRSEFGKLIVRSNTDELIGKFIIAGCEVGEKLLYIPKDLLTDANEKVFVAVVLLNQDKIENIFLFESQDVLKAKNWHIYKNSPKKNLVGIKIKKHKSKAFQKRKFGVILNNFIKLGEI